MRRTLTAVGLASLLAFAPWCIRADEPVPELMKRDVSHAGIEYLKKLRKNRTPFGEREFNLEALRAGMGSRRLPTIKDVKLIKVKIDDMPCEWVVAAGADADVRLLYIHGGGFVSGSGAYYLALAAHISKAAGCAVLLPDYRLAPEHRFPAGLDDCVRAHEWMRANGPAGASPARATFVAGDSAGGNLTLATLLALRDRRRPLPAAGIALSPTTDFTLASASLKTASDPIISARTMPVFRDHYLGKGDPRNPLASPVFGDYRGLPPLLIQAGEHEMLRDDSIRVARKARLDGIPVKLEVWPGMFHVFQSHEPLLPEAREAIAHMAAFMRASLPATDIGARRELFVDRHLIDRFAGKAVLRLHHPTPREIAFKFDQPWEGNASGYATVFQDGPIYRMYYRGHRYIIDKPPLRQAQSEVVCYAESRDGIHWVRPDLGLFDWPATRDNSGNKKNNIIWRGSPETHNFAPFKDTNPACPPDQRYKAIGGTVTSKGLLTFKSADGIRWSRLSDKPVVTQGAFDSHNTAFWDAARGRYVMYVRFFSDGEFKGLRSIGVCYSKDFHTWSDPVGLSYPQSPPQQMYTNQVAPYFRAPHVLFGFPTRYVARTLTRHVQQLDPVPLRKLLLAADERVGTDLTDGVFMSSRDGRVFHRWDEAFLRPGPQAEGRWVYGDNYQSYGLFETRVTGHGSI
ncbi:MAG: steryl acetyl hydrolase [Planctomycetes bacterium]|nr:steryl acetyl hydrolase [Planctomycetota bacterium]